MVIKLAATSTGISAKSLQSKIVSTSIGLLAFTCSLNVFLFSSKKSFWM